MDTPRFAMAAESSNKGEVGAEAPPPPRARQPRSPTRDLCPTMAWQSYQLAVGRMGEEDAEDKLLEFLKLMGEYVPGAECLAGMPVPSKLGLDVQSFMFRDFPDVWILSKLPGDVVRKLEAVISRELKQLQVQHKEVVQSGTCHIDSVSLEKLRSGLIFMTCLSGRTENNVRLSQCNFTLEVPKIGKLLLQLLQAVNDRGDKLCSVLCAMVQNCLAYIHGLYDPARMWKLRFVRELKKVGHIRTKPPFILPVAEEFFLECFHTKLCEWSLHNADVVRLQVEALHMFGAVMSAHESNAFQIITPRTTGLILSLLDPRDTCNPLQELSCKVFIKLIHIMHGRPHSELFDVDVLLTGYISFLGPRVQDGNFVIPCPKFLILMLDSLQRLMAVTVNKSKLSLTLAEVGCFQKISNVFALLEGATDEERSSVVAHIIRAICAILRGCSEARKMFANDIGYRVICEGVKLSGAFTDEVLIEFIHLATEQSGSTVHYTQSIQNPKVIPILLNWISDLDHHQCVMVLDQLKQLIPGSVFNKHQCCREGAIAIILSVLGSSQTEQTYLGQDVEDKLCHLFESLAGHSIMPNDVKQLFSILRPFEDRELPSYYCRLLESISCITKEGAVDHPRYYFDLCDPESYLSVPALSHWCNDGFTFSGWVSISQDKGGQGTRRSSKQNRRMLYSVHSGPSAGFEAFFTGVDILVVAIVTKKHYTTVRIPDCNLSTGWHHIAVVHHFTGRFTKKQCEVTVYIDGQQIWKNTSLEAPAVTESTSSVFIGSSHQEYKQTTEADTLFNVSLSAVHPNDDGFLEVSNDLLPVRTTRGKEAEQLGEPTSLQGLMGPVCLFSEPLSSATVHQLSSTNPNDYAVFQPYGVLPDLSSRLLVYYHPKACTATTVCDLSPSSVKGKDTSAQFKGGCYVAFRLKDVFTSVGGVESLFPLLEYVDLPTRTFPLRQADSKEEEQAEIRAGQKEGGTTLDAGSSDVPPACSKPSSVSLFLSILKGMLIHSPVSKKSFDVSNGPATLGCLLAKVSPNQLTLPVLESVYQLVNTALGRVTERGLPSLIKHVLFDFRIWTKPSYPVRIGHIQYISSIIKDHPELCRQELGPRALLDVVRHHYLPGLVVAAETGQVRITLEEAVSIRAGLLSCIKYYARYGLTDSEVDNILNFTLSIEDADVQSELLSLLHSLLSKGDHATAMAHIVAERGACLVAFAKAKQLKIRILIVQVLCVLINKHEISSGSLYECLHQGPVAAAVYDMCDLNVSSTLVLSLMELCVSKSENYTDYISCLSVFTATLTLLKSMSMVVRHTVCQQVLTLLHFNPHHVTEILSLPRWEAIILGLLTETSVSPTSPPPFETVPGSPIEVKQLSMESYADMADMQDRLIAVLMEVVGVFLWASVLEGTHRKVWRSFFLALDLFSADHCLLIPAHAIKQQLFLTLCEIIKRQVEGKHSPSGVQVMGAVLTLAELFEDFVTGSHLADVPVDCNGATAMELGLDTKRCTSELLESFMSLMQDTGAYSGSSADRDMMELAQLVLRLLLACFSLSNREYCSYGATQLQQLVSESQLSSEEVHYMLSVLATSLTQLGEDKLDRDCKEYVASSIKAVLARYGRVLGTDQLEGLPQTTSNHIFNKELMDYVTSSSWTRFMENKVLPVSTRFCADMLLPALLDRRRETAAIRALLEEEEAARQDLLHQAHSCYNHRVLDMAVCRLEDEKVRQGHTDAMMQARYDADLSQWRAKRRFFTGERGVWSSRVAERYSWKLDRTENFSRMRMKLIRSYPYNPHTEASIMRDDGTLGPSEVEELAKKLMEVKVAASVNSEIDELFNLGEGTLVETPTLQRAVSDVDFHAPELSVSKVECQLVMLMEKFPGKLEVTTKNINFVPDQQEVKESLWYSLDFKIPLSQLREIHSRRYNLSRTALEFFLIDQTNYFVNFTSKQAVVKVFHAVVDQDTPNLVYRKLKSPRDLLESSGLTKKWIRREISNFEYLMQLNTIAGRTYNDLNQYPVLPWVLRDFTSPQLDLNDERVFRDFSKPMGAQSERMEQQARCRYEEFEDPSGTIAKFNYGTHYSNAAGVLHYLLRLEPFASLHIQLQSGRFDDAGRQFISLERSYDNILHTSSDVKEVIPEFFYLPEMFVNVNRYNLGETMRQEVVNDVRLPPWASSPEDFVRKHMMALESEHVSQNLPNWIDLIFGYKQQGEEAVKACNVFYYCTYEGKVDLRRCDLDQRVVLEKMIENFGQTPTQLFKSAHPQRLSAEEAHRALKSDIPSGTNPATFTNLFENIENLKAFAVDVSEESDAVVFIATPAMSSHTIINTGNPETLVCVTTSGAVSVHSWLAHHATYSKSRPFIFNKDPNSYNDRSKWHYIGAPFAPNIVPSSAMFVTSRSNKLLVSAGHWDNSFRVESLEKGKIIARVAYHQAVVTCMALDASGCHLITGSRDLTCAIWGFSKDPKSFEHPLQTLYGHDDEVTCVGISVELDVAVSGSKDGTCIVHTVQQARYVHTLCPSREGDDGPRTVKLLAVSSLGRIVVYSELQPSDDRVKLDPCLHLYSINGKLLLNEALDQTLTSLLVHQQFLVTGGQAGQLLFRDLFSLARITKLEVKAGVSCLSLAREHSHLFVGLHNGKMLIITPPKKKK